MKNIGMFEVLVAVLITAGIVELVRGYWQILLALAVVGVLSYVIFRGNKPKPEFSYEVRKQKIKSPPMPCSSTSEEVATADFSNMPVQSKAYAKLTLTKDINILLDQIESGELERQQKLYDEYFDLSERIRTCRDINDKLAACEASFEILPEFVKAIVEDYGELPPTILCRDEAPKLYMRLGQWKKARSAINKCIKAGAYADDGIAALSYLARYEQTAKSAIEFLKDNGGFPQRKIYAALPDLDSDCLKSFVRSSLLIRKEPDGKTNRLYAAKDLR